jgi:hypothetical protein
MKCEVSSVRLGYDVLPRDIWIATVRKNVPLSFTSVKMYQGLLTLL